jgi:hypothetical protein
MEIIRELITTGVKRTPLSLLICERFGWKNQSGKLKEMSCRVAMLRMQQDGLIQLPPPRQVSNRYHRRDLPETDPALFVPFSFEDIRLEIVSDKKSSALWNSFIDRYHYLGHQSLPGAQLRYFAKAGDQIIALLGFGAAAWTTQPRDTFIGWSHETRKKNLHLIVNNARFLILPWISVKNLASRLLAIVAKRIAQDWALRYHYRPVLLETFVELPRFQGTCYKAANWIYVGITKGRGKLEPTQQCKLPKKSIWVYPLVRNFKTTLVQ